MNELNHFLSQSLCKRLALQKEHSWHVSPLAIKQVIAIPSGAWLYWRELFLYEPDEPELPVQHEASHGFSPMRMIEQLEQLEQQVEAPLRCHAAEVMQQLRLIAAGVADFKLAAPVEYSGGILLKVDGWIIHLVLDGDALAFTHRATAPDERCWVYGCERDDWILGPDSRIIDPLLLLQQQEREQLLEVLQQQPAPACKGVMPMTASRPAQQAAEASAKRRKRAA